MNRLAQNMKLNYLKITFQSRKGAAKTPKKEINKKLTKAEYLQYLRDEADIQEITDPQEIMNIKDYQKPGQKVLQDRLEKVKSQKTTELYQDIMKVEMDDEINRLIKEGYEDEEIMEYILQKDTGSAQSQKKELLEQQYKTKEMRIIEDQGSKLVKMLQENARLDKQQQQNVLDTMPHVYESPQEKTKQEAQELKERKALYQEYLTKIGDQEPLLQLEDFETKYHSNEDVLIKFQKENPELQEIVKQGDLIELHKKINQNLPPEVVQKENEINTKVHLKHLISKNYLKEDQNLRKVLDERQDVDLDTEEDKLMSRNEENQDTFGVVKQKIENYNYILRLQPDEVDNMTDTKKFVKEVFFRHVRLQKEREGFKNYLERKKRYNQLKKKYQQMHQFEYKEDIDYTKHTEVISPKLKKNADGFYDAEQIRQLNEQSQNIYRYYNKYDIQVQKSDVNICNFLQAYFSHNMSSLYNQFKTEILIHEVILNRQMTVVNAFFEFRTEFDEKTFRNKQIQLNHFGKRLGGIICQKLRFRYAPQVRF